MTVFNRTDDDCHKFNIPDEKLERFDDLMEELHSSAFLSDDWYDTCAKLDDEFREYMV